MLTIPFLKENRDLIIQRLTIKNFDASSLVDEILSKDDQRRESQVKTNDLQAEMNQISKEIGVHFKNGDQEKGNQLKSKTAEIKDSIKDISAQMQEASEKLQELLVLIPNIPHELVPPGKSEQDNVMIREGGEKPTLPDNAMPHWELGSKYDILDFDLGVKITGAGFPVYKGIGAKLQRALISYFLDKNINAGYREIIPPLMVNPASGFGTGQYH